MDPGLATTRLRCGEHLGQSAVTAAACWAVCDCGSALVAEEKGRDQVTRLRGCRHTCYRFRLPVEVRIEAVEQCAPDQVPCRPVRMGGTGGESPGMTDRLR